MPKSGIPGSYGSSIYSFLRNLHTVLHRGCTNSYSHQQSRMVPVLPHALQYLLFVDFLMMTIVTSVRQYPTVVLTCIALIISNIVHTFFKHVYHLTVFFTKSETLGYLFPSLNDSFIYIGIPKVNKT